MESSLGLEGDEARKGLIPCEIMERSKRQRTLRGER